jgi:Mg-chelatase subunit ChlD
MRRIATLAIALLLAATALYALVRVAPPPVTAAQGVEDSPCVPYFSKSVSPTTVNIGESVTITLHARAVCPTEVVTRHIVLVLDASGSMTGRPRNELVAAATQFVRDLDLPHEANVRVGIVSFSDRATVLTALTNSEPLVIGAINRVQANGETRIDLGIRAATQILLDARTDTDGLLTETMVVLTDGGNNAGCDPVRAAAAQARSEGILVLAICVGGACDEECMRRVALDEQNYNRVDDTTDLPLTFGAIRRRILGTSIANMTIGDTLPASMMYIAGSAEPEPSAPENPVQWMEWTSAWVPREGVTLSLRAYPTTTGVLDTNLEAHGILTDLHGRTREWEFDIPSVTVIEPGATPAPPPESPCSVEASVSADPPKGAAGEAVTVSHHVQVACPLVPFHLVLVLDGSGGMAGTPREQVVAGARALVRGLELAAHPNAQVGVVAFNSAATTLAPLTNSEDELLAAIERLGATDGSRIDTGIIEGLRVLRLGRAAEPGSEVLMLLSNGHSDAGCTPALLAADQVKAQGVLVWTLAVGADADEDCMAAIATSRRYAFSTRVEYSLQRTGLMEMRDRTLGVRSLAIEGLLSEDVEYVADSAVPALARVPADDSAYRWQVDTVPADGVTHTMRVRPLRDGVTTPREMTVALTDRRGGIRTVEVDVPTADPTATSTAVIPTPSAPIRPLFLPIALHNNCPCNPPPMDLAILLDASPSMAETVMGDGRTKIEVAKDAARILVGQTARHDRVTVIVSSGQVPTVEPLTDDREAIGRAIAGAVVGTGSRLDIAIRAALEELTPIGVSHGGPLVILTDGRASSPQDVIAAAEDFKANSGRLMVLAVGEDADVDFLARIASHPHLLFRIPGDVNSALRYVSPIPCPPGYCPQWP